MVDASTEVSAFFPARRGPNPAGPTVSSGNFASSASCNSISLATITCTSLAVCGHSAFSYVCLFCLKTLGSVSAPRLVTLAPLAQLVSDLGAQWPQLRLYLQETARLWAGRAGGEVTNLPPALSQRLEELRPRRGPNCWLHSPCPSLQQN